MLGRMGAHIKNNNVTTFDHVNIKKQFAELS